MLGSFELQGIEWIESSERRALVEHRVPGLAGSYFQDLGTAPNLIVITGSNYTGMDPEVSNFGIQPIARNIEVAQYPRSRSFWFTLSVGF